MATIEDVARAAGVSVATISRVLNNSNKVKQETAEKVRRTIEEVGYTPNLSARNLRRNESRVILVLAPNFSNPFYTRTLLGISDKAREIDYSAFICDTGGSEKVAEEYLEMLENGRADGVICLNCNFDYRWPERFLKYPMVQCAEYTAMDGIPKVCIDNYRAAYESVQYLLSLGHTRIGTISSSNRFISTKLRLQGYRDALEDAGIAMQETYVACADDSYTFDSGLLAAEELLKQENTPTALFCISDILALSAIAKGRELGLETPDDLMVMGFDDVAYAKIFHPYLTTVVQPCYDLGYQSMELLQQCIQDKENAPKSMILPYQLKIRESTAEGRKTS